MRILLVGAGGVGAAFAAIAARRDFFEAIVIADYDEAQRRAGRGRRRPVHGRPGRRLAAPTRSPRCAASTTITHVMNAVDPRFVMPIFDGAFAAGADYLDMAMSLSRPHPEAPYEKCGVKLGDEQFAAAARLGGRPAGSRWSASASSPASPTSSRGTPPTTCSPRSTSSAPATAPTSPSTDDDGEPIFAPSFSIWTTIEECLNPPVIWEERRRWLFTTPPFSEPEVFDFPEGIGPVECVNVEHEEVLLMPRWVDCKRATFKYGLGDEFIDVLKMLHKLGLDRTEKVRRRGGRGQPPRRGRRLPAEPGRARARG